MIFIYNYLHSRCLLWTVKKKKFNNFAILKSLKGDLQQKWQLANILHELVVSNRALFLQVLLGMTFGQLDAGNFKTKSLQSMLIVKPLWVFAPPHLAQYKEATSHTDRT